ncbi:NAD(P)-dependent oxidoreductase [Granulicoccus phenolivorans]|uniref:NAD(P)-dependent oxidoreductase n=1 Tax=Granulicoccus phenolivorans TaxID=266854 RepID=UPI000479C8B3|nr:NAD(P)-dependent oxidoreductase [Granulicoccus phenolivorans]
MSDQTQRERTQRIGFVGASGLMGHGMAKNLRAAGYPLAYTVNRREPEGLADAGATLANDHAELGRTCDVVFICVTSATDVEEVVTGPRGLLSEAREGLIIIDSSTSEPGLTQRLAAACVERGARFVDAPLTRGPAEAEAGTLNILVGADDDLFAELQPMLQVCAEHVIHTGPTGSGHTIKLLNNFVIQAQATALAEAFAVATKADSDPKTLVDVLSLGMANNALLAIMAKTLDGDYGGMVFELDNARKDVRYYTRLAGDLAHPVTVGDGVHESLVLASALGYGKEYVPSLVKAQAQLGGSR